MFVVMMRIDDHVGKPTLMLVPRVVRMGAILDTEVVELAFDARQMRHVDDLQSQIRKMAQVVRRRVEHQNFVFVHRMRRLGRGRRLFRLHRASGEPSGQHESGENSGNSIMFHAAPRPGHAQDRKDSNPVRPA